MEPNGSGGAGHVAGGADLAGQAESLQQTHVLPFFLPEGVAAFAEPTQNRLVLPVDDPPDQLYLLMVHEVP